MTPNDLKISCAAQQYLQGSINPYTNYESQQKVQTSGNPFEVKTGQTSGLNQFSQTATSSEKEPLQSQYASGKLSTMDAMELLNNLAKNDEGKFDLDSLNEIKYANSEYKRLQQQQAGSGELVPNTAYGQDRITNSSWYQANPLGLFA